MSADIISTPSTTVNEICINKMKIIKYDVPSFNDFLEALNSLIRFILAQKRRKMKQKLNKKLDEAKVIAINLLRQKPNNSLLSITQNGGVYIFYKGNSVLYIGKAKNLDRRIRNDHHGAEKRDSTGVLRRSINKAFGVPFGPEIKNWLQENCRFSYIEISNPDMRSLVESFLIATLRTKDLLNKG